jgi:hypothetical protein
MNGGAINPMRMEGIHTTPMNGLQPARAGYSMGTPFRL